jgi:hypothetical protein
MPNEANEIDEEEEEGGGGTIWLLLGPSCLNNSSASRITYPTRNA